MTQPDFLSRGEEALAAEVQAQKHTSSKGKVLFVYSALYQ